MPRYSQPSWRLPSKRQSCCSATILSASGWIAGSSAKQPGNSSTKLLLRSESGFLCAPMAKKAHFVNGVLQITCVSGLGMTVAFGARAFGLRCGPPTYRPPITQHRHWRKTGIPEAERLAKILCSRRRDSSLDGAMEYDNRVAGRGVRAKGTRRCDIEHGRLFGGVCKTASALQSSGGSGTGSGWPAELGAAVSGTPGALRFHSSRARERSGFL